MVSFCVNFKVPLTLPQSLLLCSFFFLGDIIELIIFHLRWCLDTWNFNLHFLTKHLSEKKWNFWGCFLISIQMPCINLVESWWVICLQFLKDNYLSLFSSGCDVRKKIVMIVLSSQYCVNDCIIESILSNSWGCKNMRFAPTAYF